MREKQNGFRYILHTKYYTGKIKEVGPVIGELKSEKGH